MSDSSPFKPFLTVMRFVVEAQSPVFVANGGHSASLETPLTRDPNGLPMLPATSIAGVLKHALTPHDAKELLGHQEGTEGTRSGVSVSDGLIHWSDDTPRDGLVLNVGELANDELASWFLLDAPIERQHVRISKFGVVDSEGKFDRPAAPAGSRYTFELSARHDDTETPLEKLAQLIFAGLRLGGATRSGYGELRCIRSASVSVDLRGKEGRKRLLKLGKVDLTSSELEYVNAPYAPRNLMEIQVRSVGPLMVGGESTEEDVDTAPYVERYVDWTGEKGAVKTRYVIPATAIKGPLRHRTTYHLHTLEGNCAGVEASSNALFGSARDGEKGAPGKLSFCDVHIPVTADTIRVAHVGLDRFTGGARKGVLFVNEMLWKPAFTIRIECPKGITGNGKAAFDMALEDLGDGDLGIGADWGDGVGILKSDGVSQNAG